MKKFPELIQAQKKEAVEVPAIVMVSGEKRCKKSLMSDIFFTDQILPDCGQEEEEEDDKEREPLEIL